MNINQLTAYFKEQMAVNNHILIYPHVSADGDAIGSCIALQSYIRENNKKSYIVLEESFPKLYSFMYKKDDYITIEQAASFGATWHIALDTGDLSRLGTRESIYKDNTLNIDHHITNSLFAKFNYLDKFASSTGEIIYELLNELDYNYNKTSATAIYVAVLTDTGGFKFSNTNKKSFLLAADLLQYDINISDINKKVYETHSLIKTKLMGKTIDKIQLFCDNQVAIATFTKDDYLSINGTEELFDGIIQIPRRIEGVRVAVIIRESLKGPLKVNLRSNDDVVDVGKIAYYNGGGGHKRAAGYTIKESTLEKASTLLINDIKKQLYNEL